MLEGCVNDVGVPRRSAYFVYPTKAKKTVESLPISAL